jgi:hypothetical protein
MNPALIMSIIQLITTVAQRPGNAAGVNQVLATVGSLQAELGSLYVQVVNARKPDGSIDAAGWDAVHTYVAEQRIALDKSLGLTQ